jgi:hypothetical protein
MFDPAAQVYELNNNLTFSAIFFASYPSSPEEANPVIVSTSFEFKLTIINQLHMMNRNTAET